MDLEHLDRPDLAQLFMHHYIEFSGTPIVASLEHHYIAYRAFVRAKVTYIQAIQGRAEAAAEADQYTRLALRHLEAGEVTLTLVGGVPGSGKTTLARALHHDTATTTADRYSDAAKAATYQDMLDRARTALQHCESVIAEPPGAAHVLVTWLEPSPPRHLAACLPSSATCLSRSPPLAPSSVLNKAPITQKQAPASSESSPPAELRGPTPSLSTPRARGKNR